MNMNYENDYYCIKRVNETYGSINNVETYFIYFKERPGKLKYRINEYNKYREKLLELYKYAEEKKIMLDIIIDLIFYKIKYSKYIKDEIKFYTKIRDNTDICVKNFYLIIKSKILKGIVNNILKLFQLKSVILISDYKDVIK